MSSEVKSRGADLTPPVPRRRDESLAPTKPWQEEPPPAPLVPSVHLVPGNVVAERYRVEQKLGEGGMAAVYRVQDLELDEVVALKVLAPDGGDAEKHLARFKLETRLARRIVHPNVCHIYDFGNWGEVYFVTMELLPGLTLNHWLLQSRNATLDAKVKLFAGIVAGLGAAHELGIVHRDVKPQNVMVDGERPVVMDFGIARDLEATGLTAAGEVLGTPEYMSPERLLGEDCDHRADIYSLGILLYELVIGDVPFVGETVFEIARNQIYNDPPSVTDLDPTVPLWLDRLILKALAKKPEERFQSTQEMLEALRGEVAVDSAETGDARSTDISPAVKVGAVRDTHTEKRLPRVAFIGEALASLGDIEGYLANGGVEVVTAETGAEGIDRVLDGEVDLVCLDFRLPEMDGLQAAELLRRFDSGREIPIFIIASREDGHYEKQALRAGVERFFIQPVDVGAFLTALGEQLAK